MRRKVETEFSEHQRMDALRKSQAIIEFTTEGIIRYANQNFLDAVGYQLDEIVGKHHSIFVPHPGFQRAPS